MKPNNQMMIEDGRHVFDEVMSDRVRKLKEGTGEEVIASLLTAVLKNQTYAFKNRTKEYWLIFLLALTNFFLFWKQRFY